MKSLSFWQPPPPQAFNPALYGTPWSWYRAEDSIVADGDRVIQVPPKAGIYTELLGTTYSESGVNYDMRPSIIPNAVGGLPAWNFAPSVLPGYVRITPTLSTAHSTTPYTSSSDWHFFAVIDAASFNNWAVQIAPTGTREFGLTTRNNRGSRYMQYSQSSAADISAVIAATGWHLVEVYRTAGIVRGVINGVTQAPTTTDTHTPASTMLALILGSTTNSPMIAEILSFSSGVSNVAAVRQYFANRTGLAITV